MRKNRIMKMVMSAAAAMYVAAMPVQAEESGEELRSEEYKEVQTGPGLGEAVQAAEEYTAHPSIEENTEKTAAGESEEAQYSAMGQMVDGCIQTAAAEKPDLEELIKKTGFGPHLLLYMKEAQAQEEEVQEEPQPPSYSEEDLYVLAHAICGEGQGYPNEEQLYIGSVILNRRAHGAYPNSIKDVVFQRGQYACTRDGNYYREPTQANWSNAKWLLENGSILPGNVVYQAGFRQGSGLYVQTRYHKYCYR